VTILTIILLAGLGLRHRRYSHIVFGVDYKGNFLRRDHFPNDYKKTQLTQGLRATAVRLTDSERILMICSAVLIQSKRLTDGQTDGIAVV